mmetsp:Transcript_57302/g.150911  ORF Transcript_57302/g.150911 Transcript_57302/m.150911 type:complete len:280 (-) Transcript_57302:1165-2004(-)
MSIKDSFCMSCSSKTLNRQGSNIFIPAKPLARRTITDGNTPRASSRALTASSAPAEASDSCAVLTATVAALPLCVLSTCEAIEGGLGREPMASAASATQAALIRFNTLFSVRATEAAAAAGRLKSRAASSARSATAPRQRIRSSGATPSSPQLTPAAALMATAPNRPAADFTSHGSRSPAATDADAKFVFVEVFHSVHEFTGSCSLISDGLECGGAEVRRREAAETRRQTRNRPRRALCSSLAITALAAAPSPRHGPVASPICNRMFFPVALSLHITLC